MKSERVDLRVPPDLRQRLTDWRRRQEFPPTEAEAIRYAIKTLVEFSDRMREEAAK